MTRKKTPPPPLLPATRPRRLTQIDHNNNNNSNDNRDSPFFRRLPPELRRAILTTALGGRTLHAHLDLQHPKVAWQPHAGPGRRQRRPRPDRWVGRLLTTMLTRKPTSGGGPRRAEGPAPHVRVVPDRTRPLAWRWAGCACHRREELEEEDILRLAQSGLCVGSRLTPDWDRCCDGSWFCTCEEWSGKEGEEAWRRQECGVGVMGWLLACRQTYAEAIDIVYSTNTFHLSGQPLLQNLSRLLLPQRLATIRNLELAWHFKSPMPQGSTSGGEQSRLGQLCDALPDLFPRLGTLYLPLHVSITRGPAAGEIHGPVMAAANRAFLPWVEALRRRLPEATEMSVGVPAQFWKVLLHTLDGLGTAGLRAEVDWTRLYGRFWKRVDDDGTRGYWLCSGADNNGGLPYTMCLFEGWGMEYSPLACPVVVYNECPGPYPPSLQQAVD